jgi:hypothetical protein
MDLLEQWVLSGQALGRGIGLGLGGPRRAPWLVDVAAHGAAIAGLAWFAFPLVSPVLAPLLAALAGPMALHYPDSSRLLPIAIVRLDLALAPLRWPLLLGWAAALDAARLRGRALDAGEAFRDTLRRLPKLLAVGMPLAGLASAAGFAGLWALGELHHGPTMAVGIVFAAGLAETFAIALAALALPVLVMRDEPLRWMGPHVEIAWRRGGTAAAWVAILLAATAVISRDLVALIGGRVAAGRPDLGPWIALGAALLSTAGAMAFCGGSLLVHALTEEPA